MGDQAKIVKLKARFAQLDRNGDGKLNFDEFKSLLMQGNSKITPKQLKALFNGVAGEDGIVDFDEFVEYIYSTEKAVGGDEAGRTTEGRHARLHQAAEAEVGDDEGDWGIVEESFVAFAKGDTLDNKEWAKLVKDCLVDKKFNANSADLIWSKVAPRGVRQIKFPEFQRAIRLVAKEKKCKVSQVQDAISSKHGPSIKATKADAVRFHDDKSTYTGAHVFNEKHGHAGAGERDSDARHKRLSEAAQADHSQPEDDWGDCQMIFDLFAQGNGLDNKEFMKLCKDCHLLNKKCTPTDIDIIFSDTKVKPRNERKIEFENFKEACRLIAKKRGVPVTVIQEAVGNSDGPELHGTKADAVRFHDDKSTYTGMHHGK